MDHNLNKSCEQHPLFPSGEWEGFYMQKSSGNQKFEMSFTLDFKNGRITGTGSDKVGGFAWEGEYDTAKEICKMTKHYFRKHSVLYDGNADENGIWGTWKIKLFWSGGFHIWPKKKNQDEEQNEESAAVKQASEIKKSILSF